MRGEVVRGVAGRRSEYRAIESRLCKSAEPGVVAQSLVKHFQFDQLYVADLDAIAGAAPAWDTYEQIASSGVRLIIDAGITDVACARKLAAYSAAGTPLTGVIAGLESVESPRLLREIVETVGQDRLIFSLDMKQGEPLTAADAWRAMSLDEIAATAYACGARRMILLDLADVGVGEGVRTLQLCERMRATVWGENHSSGVAVQLIAGGGVRGAADLARLAAAGCNAALVASALHDGRLTPADVRAIQGPAE